MYGFNRKFRLKRRWHKNYFHLKWWVHIFFYSWKYSVGGYATHAISYNYFILFWERRKERSGIYKILQSYSIRIVLSNAVSNDRLFNFLLESPRYFVFHAYTWHHSHFQIGYIYSLKHFIKKNNFLLLVFSICSLRFFSLSFFLIRELFTATAAMTTTCRRHVDCKVFCNWSVEMANEHARAKKKKNKPKLLK